MKLFFITLLFLSLPLKVHAGFPEGKNGFDIKKIIHGFDEFEKIKFHHKYLNNLNYYKTIKILN